jgi:hypothetical protein
MLWTPLKKSEDEVEAKKYAAQEKQKYKRRAGGTNDSGIDVS